MIVLCAYLKWSNMMTTLLFPIFCDNVVDLGDFQMYLHTRCGSGSKNWCKERPKDMKKEFQILCVIKIYFHYSQ